MSQLPSPPVTISPNQNPHHTHYQQLIKQHGSPLLIINQNTLRKNYQALSQSLPSVSLYYAIKANPAQGVINTLADLGCNFDIATSGEIQLLKAANVEPRRCIHTHPIKRDQDIRDALRFGCTTFVVDNLREIEKFAAYRARVGLLLRVSFPNPASPVDLSKKFGCTPSQVTPLAEKASELGLHIKGLSFHAGSQCLSPHNHLLAIESCVEILSQYNQTHERALSILDIGGGFPVAYEQGTPNIEDFCRPLRNALKKLPEHISVYAEPGRYLVAEAGTSVATVIGTAQRADGPWYYLDTGVYDLYSGRLYDHATYPLTVFSDSKERQTTTLAGPTCDSIDVVAEHINLPPLAIGDIVVGEFMGAYTNASATDFNLFPRAQVVCLDEPPEL